MKDHKQLIEFVCDKYEISHSDLYSRSIKRNISTARNIVMRLMREKLKMSISDIATDFNRTVESVYAQINSTYTRKKIKNEYEYVLYCYSVKYERKMTLDERLETLSSEKRNQIFNILNS